jgi:hypothetical protein
MILRRGGRGPLLVVAVLLAVVTGAAAQQRPVRPQPGVPPQNAVQPQPGVQPQNMGAPILGRPRPTVGPAAPRPPEPQFSASEVAPGGNNIFGRKTKGGGAGGMTNQQGMNGMGR